MHFDLRVIGSTSFLVLLAAASVAPARSQTDVPRFTMQGPAEQTNAPIIRDALGRPCLDIEAAARSQVIDKNMIDHVVSIKNKCARLIKVKVCYFNSDHCNQVDVQPYKRVDTILGSMRGNTFFRYSLKQK